MKYYIYCRYEFWGPNGKEFCKWFRLSTGKNGFTDESEAKNSMKTYKSNFSEIDRKTKLKREWEIRYQDETLFAQTKMHAGKGRYKKVTDEMLDKICAELINKQEALIDTSIGAYVYNTPKYREYINNYINEHYDSDKWVQFYHNKAHECYALIKSKDVSIIY